MTPLTGEEFGQALRKGLGRAALHLKAHGAAGLEDQLVDACLHTLCYDRQVEGSRAEWVALLVELTGNEAFYRTRLLEALSRATDYKPLRQGLDLALLWARRGHQDARRVLYNVWLADCFEQIPGEMASYVLSNYVPSIETMTDDDLAARMTEVLDDEPAGGRPVPPQPEPTLDNAERMIEDWTKDPYGGWLASFGKRMTLQEAEVAFARLLAETRHDPLVQRLSLFRLRGFPVLAPRVLEFAESSDQEVQRNAFQALARTEGTGIGPFARRLLIEQPTAALNGAIALFAQPYEPEDHLVLESLLSVPRDEDEIHTVGSDLVDVGEAVAGPELATCLLWVYEQTPCGLCRAKSVRSLVEWHAAPRHVLDECLWDSVVETRTVARSALG